MNSVGGTPHVAWKWAKGAEPAAQQPHLAVVDQLSGRVPRLPLGVFGHLAPRGLIGIWLGLCPEAIPSSDASNR